MYYLTDREIFQLAVDWQAGKLLAPKEQPVFPPRNRHDEIAHTLKTLSTFSSEQVSQFVQICYGIVLRGEIELKSNGRKRKRSATT